MKPSVFSTNYFSTEGLKRLSPGEVLALWILVEEIRKITPLPYL